MLPMSRLSLARCATPLGEMLLASEGAALTGAWFEGQRYYAAGVCAAQAVWHHSAPLRAACAWLESYFGGAAAEALPPMPPLAPAGTPFQQAVWQLLQGIPYGSFTTYGKLAEQLIQSGIRASAQAVGGAVGRNRISLFIPCHRVLAATGALTGYAAGLQRKSHLLQLESRAALSLHSSYLK